MGEKILDVFAREFRAHPAEEYERCIRTGTLTVNYEKVPIDYRLKHNDLLANIVHRYVVTGVEIELYTNCQNKRYRKITQELTYYTYVQHTIIIIFYELVFCFYVC